MSLFSKPAPASPAPPPASEPAPDRAAPGPAALALDAAMAEGTAADGEVEAAAKAQALAADHTRFKTTAEQVAAVEAADRLANAARIARERATAKIASAKPAAAEEVKARVIEDAKSHRQALGIAARAMVEGVMQSAAHLAPGVALVRTLLASLGQDATALRKAGVEPEPIPASSLVGLLPDLMDPRPGDIGVLASALALAISLEAAPARALAAAQEAEAREAERVRRYDDEARRGHHGQAEMDAAHARLSRGVAAFYAGSPAAGLMAMVDAAGARTGLPSWAEGA